MKTGTLATRIMLAAVFITVLIYFGVNLTAYFNDPYTTTAAYAFTGENAATVSGYVVRDEEALEGGGDLVYSSRGEGERVSQGGTVALIYPTQQALNNANTLRELTSQMDQLLYARSLSAGSQASARLDEEISAALAGFRGAMADGSLSGAEESGQTLRTAVLRRSYAYFGDGGLDASISSLQAQIDSLSPSVEDGVTRISAPKAGLFSGLVDGYESVLNLENIMEMTPGEFRAVAPVKGGSSVGKMVYGSKWAFVTLMRSEDVKKIKEGDTITIRFQKGMDDDVSMKVSRISEADGGRRVVVFTSERYLQLTTLLRHQNAQIIFESYDGIRVPRGAVRVETQVMTDENGEPVLDSRGKPRNQTVTCVYCLWGDTARQNPIKILWQEDEYILAAPDEEALSAFSSERARESRRLRPGDQVITAAAEIYDGKVVR